MSKHKRDNTLPYCPTCYNTGEVALEDGEIVPCWNCARGQSFVPDPKNYVTLAEQSQAWHFEHEAGARYGGA